LGSIATDGSAAFYTGPIARDIVAAATDTSGGRTPSLITSEDLARYTAKKREPLCLPYRDHEICGMPPPSSGGIAVAATLGILERFPMGNYRPTDVDLNGGRPTVMGVHLIAEAERLAYADRDKYVADTDFVPLPGGSPDTLLNASYLAGRAALISEQRSMGTAQPGELGAPPSPAPPTPEHGTSHISVVDSYGNAAALTTTVESAFGSFHMVDGFILNNQLTDFAAEPVNDGTPVPNRIQPGKRPRSTMSPTLIFDRAPTGRGQLNAVLGSPGGSVIIQYVVKTLVGMLDWGLNPQQAVSMVDFGAANSPKTNVGGEHPNVNTADNGDHDALVQGLRVLGHQVDLADQSSGLSAISRSNPGWQGGADPRREGLVMGDT
jgi:gamma-glutamyltranspeptidase/glutathione hydrolase